MFATADMSEWLVQGGAWALLVAVVLWGARWLVPALIAGAEKNLIAMTAAFKESLALIQSDAKEDRRIFQEEARALRETFVAETARLREEHQKREDDRTARNELLHAQLISALRDSEPQHHDAPHEEPPRVQT